MATRAVALLVVLLSGSGCSLKLNQDQGGGVAKNECKSDSDCGNGSCRSGMCVAHEGTLDTLLLSVVPPTDVSGVGGARFLSVATGLSRSHQDYNIDIHPVSRVTGFFKAPDTNCALLGDASYTVPVEVTFTPHESTYGLPSVSYVAKTRDPAAPTSPCTNLGLTKVREFVVDLPAGAGEPSTALYDVYARPQTNEGEPLDPSLPGAAGCDYVPVLLHDFSVDGRDQCRPLTLSSSQSLTFSIQPPQGGNLDDWTVDMVHPISGQRISNQVHLPVLGTQTSYSATLLYSKDPTLAVGKEIVRLSPPPKKIQPTLHFELSGITATSVAATPPLGIFPDPVPLEAWVWSAKDFDNNQEVLVPATVTFTATKLAGVANGVVASYTTTVETDGTSQMTATLLPGTYRVEVVPQVGLGFAATETEIIVPCDRDPAAPDQCLPGTGTVSTRVQSGRVVLVPKAASVAGSLVEPLHGNPIDNASVQISAATIGQARCNTDAGADAGACAGLPLHLFDTLLGQDAFVPRSATTISDHGSFTLPAVDCGACTAGNGAWFDLTATSPDGSRLPWLVHPSLEVDVGRIDLGRLDVKLPIAQWGVVQLPIPNKEPVRIPRALIRAYVLRDQSGNVITDPVGMPSCANPESAAATGTAPCIRSVLQVAEARSHDDGSFELILPSTLDPPK